MYAPLSSLEEKIDKNVLNKEEGNLSFNIFPKGHRGYNGIKKRYK